MHTSPCPLGPTITIAFRKHAMTLGTDERRECCIKIIATHSQRTLSVLRTALFNFSWAPLPRLASHDQGCLTVPAPVPTHGPTGVGKTSQAVHELPDEGDGVRHMLTCICTTTA